MTRVNEQNKTEEDVFWLGGAPSTRKRPGEPSGHLADVADFQTAVQARCQSAGGVVKQFVSARGPYGTWIVEFSRADRAERIVWNGREERLILQIELLNGGWEDPVSIAIASRDEAGFLAGVEQLLANQDS